MPCGYSGWIEQRRAPSPEAPEPRVTVEGHPVSVAGFRNFITVPVPAGGVRELGAAPRGPERVGRDCKHDR